MDGLGNIKPCCSVAAVVPGALKTTQRDRKRIRVPCSSCPSLVLHSYCLTVLSLIDLRPFRQTSGITERRLNIREDMLCKERRDNSAGEEQCLIVRVRTLLAIIHRS